MTKNEDHGDVIVSSFRHDTVIIPNPLAPDGSREDSLVPKMDTIN